MKWVALMADAWNFIPDDEERQGLLPAYLFQHLPVVEFFSTVLYSRYWEYWKLEYCIVTDGSQSPVPVPHRNRP